MKTICQFIAGSTRRFCNGFPAALFLLLLLLLFIVPAVNAQVNAYARVSAISGTTLTLANANTTYHTFTAGNQVIVMQMQDNTIGSNTANTTAFGALSAIANVGFYEVATISSVGFTAGVPTSMVLTAALKKTYTIGANSRVQVISFRSLSTTNYSTTANITALAWDGNIGGVVAIQVGGTLTLKNSITASGLGFRGGAVSADYEVSCEPGVYTSSSSNYAYKGEGIYLSTNTGYTNGRARILTGGGGGSDDNGGGGGGGNLTGGGDGGPGWTCSDVVTPSTASGGLGGIALLGYSLATRIYMGGGGGGGQQNNDVGTAGGNGGGIVLIKANAITTSCTGSVSITANGVAAAVSGNDGAGGGGAGGTIVLQAATVSAIAACPLAVQASGGDGGDVGNTAAHGGGGGGGQGAIYSSVSLSVANVTATTANGTGGTNSSAAGATTAGNGTGVSNTGVVSGVMSALPVTLVAFTAAVKEKAVPVNWSTSGQYQNQLFNIQRSADGQSFTTIGSVTGTSTDMTTRNYSFTDNSILAGKRFYRLEMIDLFDNKDYSATVAVNAGEVQSALVAYPNPARQQFVVQVSGAGNRPYELVVSDLSGKPVYHNTYQSVNNLIGVTLDRVLSPGTYLIKLSGNNTTQFGKIMIL